MASCSCVKHHTPKLVVTDKHHVVPQSWGGQTVPENLVEICPSTHYTTHALLNEYVRANGVPPAVVLRRYPAYAQNLAQRAVDGVGGKVPHVFTATYPAEGADHA